MSLSNAVTSYQDVQEILSRAMASQKGIRVKVGTKGAAVQLRQRLYKFRLADRNDSKKMYAAEDFRHGKSDFDSLRVDLQQDPDETWAVVIRKFDPESFERMIEEL